MSPNLLLVIFVGTPVALGFLASLIFGKRWTCWVAVGVTAGYFLAIGSWPHYAADELARVLAFVGIVGLLGFAAATVGVWLRRELKARRRVAL